MKLSFDQIRHMLYEAIQDRASGPETSSRWVREVYEDEFVYSDDTKLYKAPYRVENGAVVVGTAVEVKEEREYVEVFTAERLFTAMSESREDGVVVRRGKLFEAGDFPDKGVSFDEADLEKAVETFAPVPNDLEHRSTIFDGKLGRLARVWKDGKELFGEVELPAWLDKTIGKEPIKVSLAFDRSKSIVGNALCLRPRIEDAAIQAAFSASLTTPGSGFNGHPKKMTIRQAIRKLLGTEDVANLDAEINLSDRVLAAIEPEGEPGTPAPEPTPAPAPAAAPTPAPAFTDNAVNARVAALEAQLVHERAVAFADDVIRANKAVPAQRDAIVSAFKFAVNAGSGSVFSADTNDLVETDGLKALRQLFDGAAVHAFTGERLEGAGIIGFGSSEKVEKEKVDELLALTPFGQKIKAEAEASK